MLYPTYFAESISDITTEFLKKENAKGVILDVDDTLAPSKIIEPKIEVISWIEELRENDIKAILLSNNFDKRVRPLAEKLNLPYISFGLKPLTTGLKKAIKAISCDKSEVFMIGDQIFTDILAANLMKMRSVLVKPLTVQKDALSKMKRKFEKIVKEKMQGKNYVGIENIKSNSLEGKNR